jgi:hypothetical protein
MNINYINAPPDTIDCIYCGHSCSKTEQYEEINEYFCFNHGEAEVMFRCAKHKGLGWFFNVTKVTRGKWRLSWTPEGGYLLQKLIPAEERKWGEHWATVSAKVPVCLLRSNIKMLSSFLNLYRVFS